MKKIIIAHDGSKQSEKAAKKAMEIAAGFKAAVIVVGIIPEIYLTELVEMDRVRILDSLTAEARASLERVRKMAKPGMQVKTMIKYGSPATEILAIAKKEKADLIVTGSHGRHGATKFLLGSVSSKIVDHATCSVLVVK